MGASRWGVGREKRNRQTGWTETGTEMDRPGCPALSNVKIIRQIRRLRT